jgi:hypothetical protein
MSRPDPGLLALDAGIVSFLIPPKWDIDAIIQPGKSFIQSASPKIVPAALSMSR